MKRLDNHDNIQKAYADVDKLLSLLKYYTVPHKTLQKYKELKDKY